LTVERSGVIYSLGTGARSLEEFLALLKGNAVAVAADVRSFPSSRRFPHFSREDLRRSLEAEGIAYVWLGNRLGGFRRGGYEAHTRTGDFRKGLEELEGLARLRPTAFFCAEREPSRCHRRFIARALRERGWEVVDLGTGGGPSSREGQGVIPLGEGE